MTTALTFADILAEERARILREGGWSDAARMAALCARTRDSKYCSQVKSSTKQAVKGTVQRVKKALTPREQTPEERAEVERTVATVRRAEAGRVRDYEDTKRRREETRRQGKAWAPSEDDVKRAEEESKAAVEDISPRYLSGPKKGQRKKKFKLGLAVATAAGF